MRLSNEWIDYECIDAGNGEKLERWGNIILRRPEPQAMWPIEMDKKWNDVSGTYYRFKDGGGHWEFNESLPEYWTVNYKNLKFKVSPTNFKHTGLFPEQATNWDFMMDKIKNAGRPIKVLNLFAYTGAATMACSMAGADVVHVDAAKGMVQWAKENHIHRIEGSVREKNIPAIGLYLKHGFVLEGLMRDKACINGVWHNEYMISKMVS